MQSLIPNFNYYEETDLLCVVALGLAHARELAEVSPFYWNDRVVEFEKVFSKLQKEVKNYHQSN